MPHHPANICRLLPKRAPDSHKGTYGRVLIIAGSSQYTGAAELAVEGALRSGVGMVVVATISSVASVIQVRSPEAVVVTCEQKDGCLLGSTYGDIVQLMDTHRITSVCMGPGLGNVADADVFYGGLMQAMAARNIACVVDADALVPVARGLVAHPMGHNQVVLTPHPKSLRALLRHWAMTH